MLCFYFAIPFTIPVASTPGSGGQVRVTVSEQTNGRDDDEAVCV